MYIFDYFHKFFLIWKLIKSVNIYSEINGLQLRKVHAVYLPNKNNLDLKSFEITFYLFIVIFNFFYLVIVIKLTKNISR